MPNYQNGKLYTIRSHQTKMIYIGSTTQSLSTRLAGHRRRFKRWKNGKCVYITSFEILKYDDAYIELLRECKCDNRQQLCAIEGQWVRRCRVAVNKRIEGRTNAEYYQDNKQEKLVKQKQRYQANKEEIAAKKKQKYQNNKNKYVCYECDHRFNQKCDLTRHKKTNKHLKMVAFLIECGGPDYNNFE